MRAPPPILFALGLAAAMGSAGCDSRQPGQADWGFEAIDSMPTPPDPPLTCGAVIPADGTSAQRLACAFGMGQPASQTLGIDGGTLAALPIRHVIVVMRENRSFDHLLGHLHDRGQPEVEGIPATYMNPDPNGNPVFPGPAETTCISADPGHQSDSMLACIDGGRMDGFVVNAERTTRTDGRFVMSNYDAADLPFYYWLASTFAVNDRHFAAIASGTYPNRNFLLFASNAGVEDTGLDFPPPSTPSIMRLLMNAGYTWGVYTDSSPFSGALNWHAGDPGVHPLQEFLDALDAGTLPNVAFVDGRVNIDDDHPTADLQAGEAWVHTIYQHMVTSPQLARLAMIWTYDEGGGFADHVPPEPPACAAGPDSPSTQRGPRVPLVVISPWARLNAASHVVEDHTAITRLIEALFGLPALTSRDANSTALLELFDFSCGRDMRLPVPPAPGVGGCARFTREDPAAKAACQNAAEPCQPRTFRIF
jgi:phospholipase C